MEGGLGLGPSVLCSGDARPLSIPSMFPVELITSSGPPKPPFHYNACVTPHVVIVLSQWCSDRKGPSRSQSLKKLPVPPSPDEVPNENIPHLNM